MTSLALLGGLGGLGRGMNDVGRQMELDALEARRQQNLADIAAARDASREEIAAGRLGAGGTRSSGTRAGGGTGGSSLRDLMDDPEVMAFAAAKDREKMDDARAMAKGQRLTKEVEGEQPMDEEGNVMPGPGAPKTVDKYEPGTAQKVREEGRDAFWEAMKLAHPAQADDLSKSQRTDQGTKLAADYAKGNDRAGEAALINDSKPAFDDGSSNATGKVTPGSLADAKASAEGTKAGAAVTRANAAAAKSARTGGGTGSERRADLALSDQERKAATTLLSDARKALTAEEVKLKPDPAKVQELEAEIAAAKSKLAPRAPTAAAPKATVKALPAGAKQIGTSGGKPVYQTPDGKKFIGS
jgi:hypothetical protein